MYRTILFTALVACLAVPGVSHAQARAAAPAGGASEYRIGPDDVLDVQVWGRSDLKGSVVVDSNGRIQVPLVGEASAGGRTTAELARDLTQRYQLLDPSVSEVVVTVTAYNSRSVTVLGEVRTPGQFGFRDLPDVWGALFAAGGPTATADLSAVQVIRATAPEGESRMLTVDLSRGIDATPAESLPVLRPKDRIVVPSAGSKGAGPDSFHILGAVRVPGPYRIGAASTVVEALSVSGGMLPTAELDKVYLTRLTPDGVLAYKLDIKSYLEKGKPQANLGLKAGDTITVPEKPARGGVFAAIERLLPWASLAVTVIIASNN